MATGGCISDDDDDGIYDLFECSVCMESLIDKNPRLLHCGHTFCTPCLQQVTSMRDSICCPKCRDHTRIPVGGVKNLPLNTDLNKMKDLHLQLSSHAKIKCQMCQKQNAKAEYICTTCRKKLICQVCYVIHTKVPALKGHEVIPLKVIPEKMVTEEVCGRHEEPLDLLCIPCEEALCIVCISDPKHAPHQEKILEFKSGLHELRQTINKLRMSLDKNVGEVERGADIVKQQMNEIKKSRESLCANREILQMTLSKITNELITVTEAEENMIGFYQYVSKHANELRDLRKQLEDLSKMEDVEYILHCKEGKNKSEPLLRKTNLILNRKIEIGTCLPGNIKITGNSCKLLTKEELLKTKIRLNEKEMSEKKVLSRPMNEQYLQVNEKSKNRKSKSGITDLKYIEYSGEFSLEEPQLILDIKPGGEVELTEPSELVNAEDGTVILVNWGLSYIQRIDSHGKVTKIYKIDDEQRVEGASVYKGQLYVSCSDKTIIRMCLDNEGGSDVFQPKMVKSPWIRVVALDHDTLIISENRVNRILEYNTKHNHTRQVSSNIKPGKVCIIQSDGDTRFAVIHQHKVTKSKKVDIFDRNWKFISTVENLQDPEGLEMTPGGKLLVADRGSNSVLQYNTDGSFVRELLGPSKGIPLFSPCDIIYQSPYLWVVQRSPHSLKMFKVE